jgi:hypothetical protein
MNRGQVDEISAKELTATVEGHGNGTVCNYIYNTKDFYKRFA